MLTLWTDRLLNGCKWPLGIAALFCFPLTATLLFQQLKVIGTSSYVGLWVGFLGYVVLHFFVFRRGLFGSWLPTLEHEITHALFAWMTFHSVGGLKLTWANGGEIKVFGGEGNWLIIIAPYFFPTVPLIVLTFNLAVPQIFGGHFGFVMGLSLGFHFIATLKETRFDQPDLKKVGYWFACFFLPAANALCIAWVLSVVSHLRGFWDAFFLGLHDLIQSAALLF